MAERTGVRRVLTGVDEEGRSRIVADARTTTHVIRPDGSVVMDIWRVEGLPARQAAEDVLTDEVLPPSANGLVVRICQVPPNANMDAREYEAALARSYGMDDEPARNAQGAPGMHRTETVDVVTVVSGELVLVLETEETTLRPGDTVVQRGTKHAWHNRTDEPCLIIAVMMAACS
ncbi:cupin domain-containing protein [Streptomyces sp. NPDC004561]